MTTNQKPEKLITYCGGYCGICARWRDYTVFRDVASILGNWVDAQGYQHWMPAEVKEFNYTEFRKGLGFFSKKNTSALPAISDSAANLRQKAGKCRAE